MSSLQPCSPLKTIRSRPAVKYFVWWLPWRTAPPPFSLLHLILLLLLLLRGTLARSDMKRVPPTHDPRGLALPRTLTASSPLHACLGQLMGPVCAESERYNFTQGIKQVQQTLQGMHGEGSTLFAVVVSIRNRYFSTLTTHWNGPAQNQSFPGFLGAR